MSENNEKEILVRTNSLTITRGDFRIVRDKLIESLEKELEFLEQVKYGKSEAVWENCPLYNRYKKYQKELRWLKASCMSMDILIAGYNKYINI